VEEALGRRFLVGTDGDGTTTAGKAGRRQGAMGPMQHEASSLSMRTLTVYNLTGGRVYQGRATDPAGILVLTATGRKSGQPRAVSLVYIRDGPSYIVAASNGGRDKHPGWFFNVRSNPAVTIRVKDRRRDQQMEAAAEVAGPEKRGELWARLVAAAPYFARYQRRTAREIPMVLLSPVGGGC
jgi:F420H(2)-dependent quinone reductase